MRKHMALYFCELEKAGSVCEHKRCHGQERVDQRVVGWRQRRRWRGSADGWVGSGGLCPSSLPSWRTERPRQSPDVTYCTLPSQLPYFLFPLEWCHRPAGDVTSNPPPIPSVRPLSPLSQLGFNHWLPTVTRHSQWSTYQTQTERQTCRHSEQTQTHMYMQVCNATDINHMNNLIFSEQVNEMLINTTTKLMVWSRNTVQLVYCFMQLTCFHTVYMKETKEITQSRREQWAHTVTRFEALHRIPWPHQPLLRNSAPQSEQLI